MNPGGLASLLYWALITPSRIRNITAGAQKHTLAHANTQGDVVLWEREGRELSEFFFFFFFTQGGKSCLVEHTKIGEVWGNLQKEMMGEMSDGGGGSRPESSRQRRRLGKKIQMNLWLKISQRMDYTFEFISTQSPFSVQKMPLFGSHSVQLLQSCLTYSHYVFQRREQSSKLGSVWKK